MRASDIATLLRELYPTRRPVFLHSPPGVGKSAVCKQAADGLGLQFLDIRGLLHDPSDLKFPLVDVAARKIEWLNSIFPSDPEWQGLIVLEELPLCPALMQGAFLQVTWDRRIGEYKLPDGAWIVATGNRQEDRAGANRIITPLLNRFIHIDMEVSNEDWQAWSLTAGVAPEVRAFLNYRPGLLHQFNPALNERAFPTPRSWGDMVSKVLHVSDHLLHAAVSGCVGEGPAAEFVGFLKICKSLPDIDKVLADPKNMAVPKDPAVLFALCGALAERVRKDANALKPAFTYAARFTTEFSVLACRDFAAVNQKLFALPEAAQWLKQHRSLLLGVK